MIYQADGPFSKYTEQLAGRIEIEIDDVERLKSIWGQKFVENLLHIKKKEIGFQVRLISGSLTEYWRATRGWWENIEARCKDLLTNPVYFISSNTHGVVNLLSGFALTQQEELLNYLKKEENKKLLEEWKDIQERNVPSSKANFFYYVQKKYQQTEEGRSLLEAKFEHERNFGIVRIPSDHYFEVDAQVIRLSQLNPETIDPRLSVGDLSFLKKSNAMILKYRLPFRSGGLQYID